MQTSIYVHVLFDEQFVVGLAKTGPLFWTLFNFANNSRYGTFFRNIEGNSAPLKKLRNQLRVNQNRKSPSPVTSMAVGLCAC